MSVPYAWAVSHAPSASDTAEPAAEPSPRPSRPLVERVGLLMIAVVLAGLFGAVGVASWVNGEPFLAAMGIIGAVMTLWAGSQTLRPG